MRQVKFYLYILIFGIHSWCAASVNDVFERIKSDPNALYAFFKEMPKGGELHYHFAGGAYPEAMLKEASKGNYCLDKNTLAMSPVTEKCPGVTAADLITMPELYEQTIRAWSLKDFVPGKESGHDHFFSTFYKFMSVMTDSPVPLLAEVMQRAANQHEVYMEIMVMPDNARSANIAGLSAMTEDYTKQKQWLLDNKAFVTEIEKTVATSQSLLPDARKYLGCDKSSQQEVCHLTVKFQYHVLREQPFENFFSQAVHAFEVASRSPAIVGVNLVQAEDGPVSLRDYRKQMQVFDFLHKAYPGVPIALHAGELAQGMLAPEEYRYHIHDAIKVGHAQRIGHGVDIAYEDNVETLLNYMANNHIVVEINLISNLKILNVSGRNHPLHFYLTHNVPVVLSTDDEGVLRTDLTHQYVEAALHHGVNYPTIKQINRNALTYGFLPGKNLWEDADHAIPVSACRDLHSKKCLHYTAHNEKAALQRSLELQLDIFESGMRYPKN